MAMMTPHAINQAINQQSQRLCLLWFWFDWLTDAQQCRYYVRFPCLSSCNNLCLLHSRTFLFRHFAIAKVAKTELWQNAHVTSSLTGTAKKRKIQSCRQFFENTLVPPTKPIRQKPTKKKNPPKKPTTTKPKSQQAKPIQANPILTNTQTHEIHTVTKIE